MRWFESIHPRIALPYRSAGACAGAEFDHLGTPKCEALWGRDHPRNTGTVAVMSANTLHITNGDSVLYVWKKAGLLGTHLAWRDVLHEGPVPAGLPLEELSRIRAAYFAERGYGNPIKIHRDFEKRDATLRKAREFEEIVLWFEHDLYDQLQLLQILDALRDLGLGAGSVQLVQSDQYLGMLGAEEIMALYPKRRYVTGAAHEAAARAWQAFTSDTPQPLLEITSRAYSGLPFLRDAFVRLCEEYPAYDSGLSRTQKHILEACAQGARRREEVFRRSQAREEAAFLGDASCYREIDALGSEPAPALTLLDDGYDVTVLGRRVLAGDADWLEHQPLDRWIGGVHLASARHWRWDDTQGTFSERVLEAQG